MTALDATTGKPLWGHSLGFDVYAPLAAVHHTLVAAGSDGALVALDCTRIQPSLMWKREIGAPIAGAVAVADDRVVVGGDDWILRAFKLATGDPLWTYRGEGPMRGTPAIRDGIVYAGDDGGRLHAVSLADGTALWTRDLGAPIRCAPAVAGRIVVTTESAVVTLGLDGVEIRRWPVSEPVSSPSLAGDTVYYAAGRTLYADERALFTAGDAIRATPVIGGSRVYVGSDDHRLYCLDRESGNVIYQVEADWYVPAAPALYDDRAYFADNQRHLYCIEDFGGDAWAQFGGGPERGGYNRGSDR